MFDSINGSKERFGGGLHRSFSGYDRLKHQRAAVHDRESSQELESIGILRQIPSSASFRMNQIIIGQFSHVFSIVVYYSHLFSSILTVHHSVNSCFTISEVRSSWW